MWEQEWERLTQQQECMKRLLVRIRSSLSVMIIYKYTKHYNNNYIKHKNTYKQQRYKKVSCEVHKKYVGSYLNTKFVEVCSEVLKTCLGVSFEYEACKNYLRSP